MCIVHTLRDTHHTLNVGNKLTKPHIWIIGTNIVHLFVQKTVQLNLIL